MKELVEIELDVDGGRDLVWEEELEEELELFIHGCFKTCSMVGRF